MSTAPHDDQCPSCASRNATATSTRPSRSRCSRRRLSGDEARVSPVACDIAIALDFERLFFLVIIVPVILMFFAVFGAFSAWSYRRTGNPLPGGISTAIAFAWAIGVTFPMIAA